MMTDLDAFSKQYLHDQAIKWEERARLLSTENERLTVELRNWTKVADEYSGTAQKLDIQLSNQGKKLITLRTEGAIMRKTLEWYAKERPEGLYMAASINEHQRRAKEALVSGTRG